MEPGTLYVPSCAATPSRLAKARARSYKRSLRSISDDREMEFESVVSESSELLISAPVPVPSAPPSGNSFVRKSLSPPLDEDLISERTLHFLPDDSAPSPNTQSRHVIRALINKYLETDEFQVPSFSHPGTPSRYSDNAGDNPELARLRGRIKTGLTELHSLIQQRRDQLQLQPALVSPLPLPLPPSHFPASPLLQVSSVPEPLVAAAAAPAAAPAGAAAGADGTQSPPAFSVSASLAVAPSSVIASLLSSSLSPPAPRELQQRTPPSRTRTRTSAVDEAEADRVIEEFLQVASRVQVSQSPMLAQTPLEPRSEPRTPARAATPAERLTPLLRRTPPGLVPPAFAGRATQAEPEAEVEAEETMAGFLLGAARRRTVSRPSQTEIPSGHVKRVVKTLEASGGSGSESRVLAAKSWSFPKASSLRGETSRVVDGSTLEPKTKLPEPSSVGPVRPALRKNPGISMTITWKSSSQAGSAGESEIHTNRTLRVEDIPDIVRALLQGSAGEDALDAWTKHCVSFCSFETEVGDQQSEGVRERLSKWWTIVKHIDVNEDHPPLD